MDLQNRQIERLIHLQEDMAKRIGDGARVAAPPARVGVFVDAANVELAIDRLRTRLDWGKVLRMLTEGRQLVRAMAYSPIHDDPGVSMETQRFVEPFLDHGYKIVTKPLKRFADGSIKANVDIELALDVITMLDRLDIVCVVSGDGDFQRLVEVVQSRGVRVEVVGVGSSVASNLRNAADTFIDLATRTRDLKV
ncbi:MAG: NYN domain-containing protein [Thermoflexaceae bacterium]|nr:NYN domain-containing protein [Thermoflexaceae bacterium]